MKNPYLLIAGIFLLISIYMFAAIKYHQLLFMFRLKRGAARIAGVDDGQNKNIGVGLGRVLAPIIGIVALVASCKSAFQWREQSQRTSHYESVNSERPQKVLRSAKRVLKLKEIDLIYKGRRGNPTLAMQPSQQDKNQIIELMRSIGEALEVDDVDGTLSSSPNSESLWKIDVVSRNGRKVPLCLNTEEDIISVTTSVREVFPSSGGFVHIKIPEEYRDRFKQIAKMKTYQGGQKN